MAGPVRMELRSEGLYVHFPIGESIFRYGSLGEIAETATHTFIYVGGVQAVALPKQGVDDVALRNFLDELKRRIES